MLSFKMTSSFILPISQSIFHQMIKKMIFSKSIQKGLLKNLQDGIFRPLWSREIQEKRGYNFKRHPVVQLCEDKLYSILCGDCHLYMSCYADSGCFIMFICNRNFKVWTGIIKYWPFRLKRKRFEILVT